MDKKNWAYRNPVRVCADAGGFSRLAEYVPAQGRILLVTTPGFTRRGATGNVSKQLGAERLVIHDAVTPNPELDDLDAVTERLAGDKFECIVALGGGSVLDAAKVLSVTIPSGVAKPLQRVLRDGAVQGWRANIPVIAIPTTSGTGAEVTPFATVWDRATHKKHSVTGEIIIPRLALLDPELTLGLPAQETLYTGLDAISHALESLWNKNRTAISEAYATQALRMAIDALPQVLAQPNDVDARGAMQQASLLAGLAISQTRTAIAHSISYPLTSHFGMPHGLACSFTLVNIISQYVESGSAGKHAELMLRVQGVLQSLDLFSEVARYASEEQIHALRDEMFTSGRADNFAGRLDSLDKILSSGRSSQPEQCWR